jgi:hypothetical protein
MAVEVAECGSELDGIHHCATHHELICEDEDFHVVNSGVS